MLHIGLLLVIKTTNVNGFSNGAPVIACRNGLVPMHGGFSPSPSFFLPFIVNTSEFVGRTYIPNRVYTSKYTAACCTHVATIIYISSQVLKLIIFYFTSIQLGYVDSPVTQPFEDL